MHLYAHHLTREFLQFPGEYMQSVLNATMVQTRGMDGGANDAHRTQSQARSDTSDVTNLEAIRIHILGVFVHANHAGKPPQWPVTSNFRHC